MMETHLYSAILKGLERDGYLLFKIVDGSAGKKPFDISGINPQGLAVAIEVKIWKRKNSPSELPESIFEKHQLAWCRAYAKLNGMSFALIYETETKRMRMYSFNLEHHGVSGWCEDLVRRDSVWRMPSR